MPKQPTTKRKIGRPLKFTPAMVNRICDIIASGQSLRTACKRVGVSKSVAQRWFIRDETYRDQYARAMEARADHYNDEQIEIADDVSGDTIAGKNGGTMPNQAAVRRAEVRIQTRQWFMARMAPKKYGDKQQIEHTGTIIHELQERMDEIQARRERPVIDVAPEPLPLPAIEHRPIAREHKTTISQTAPDDGHGPVNRPPQYSSYGDYLKASAPKVDRNADAQQAYADWVKKRNGQG